MSLSSPSLATEEGYWIQCGQFIYIDLQALVFKNMEGGGGRNFMDNAFDGRIVNTCYLNGFNEASASVLPVLSNA